MWYKAKFIRTKGRTLAGPVPSHIQLAKSDVLNDVLEELEHGNYDLEYDLDSDRRPRKRHPRFLLTTSTYAHGSLGHQTSLGRPVDDQPQELPPRGAARPGGRKGEGSLQTIMVPWPISQSY